MIETSAPSSAASRPSGKRRIAIAGILAFMLAAAAGMWLYRDVFMGREERLVRRALDLGRHEEASEILDRWLETAPDSAEAHFLKARIAWGREDLPTVDRELARAQSLGYAGQALTRLRGLLLARGSQISEAEELLRQTFDRIQEPDAEVAEALARIYLGTFRLGDAAAVLDRWMHQLPVDARPYLLQTEIDTRTKAAPQVIIEHYQAALERDPLLDRARFGLAEQLRLNRRHTEAATEYHRYLARKPDDSLGYLGAGQNALEMGDLGAATTLLDRALALSPHNAEALAARGTLELRLGHVEAALHYVDEAVKADPFDHWNHYQRMLILSRMGKTAEAQAEHEVVERLKNEHEHFNKISHELLSNPTDALLRAEASRWLMTHGHANEAIEWANLVLQSDPSHTGMNRMLADYYRKSGQTGLANYYESHLGNGTSETRLTP